MIYIKTYEQHSYTHGYWMLPFDSRFENTVVNLFKEFPQTEDLVQLIDNALNFCNVAKQLIDQTKYKYIYISINLKNNTYAPFEIDRYTEEQLKNNKYVFLGLRGIDQLELDAIEYNL